MKTPISKEQCLKKMQKVDLYGKPVGVNMDGDHVIRTWPGACVSIFTYLIIIFFVLNRLLVMTNR